MPNFLHDCVYSRSGFQAYADVAMNLRAIIVASVLMNYVGFVYYRKVATHNDSGLVCVTVVISAVCVCGYKP